MQLAALVSLVRSNENRACGFSTHPPRLNVAFSRAKRGLVVCGDLHQFCHGDQFGDLWDFIDTQSEQGCVVDEQWNVLTRAKVVELGQERPAAQRAVGRRRPT